MAPRLKFGRRKNHLRILPLDTRIDVGSMLAFATRGSNPEADLVQMMADFDAAGDYELALLLAVFAIDDQQPFVFPPMLPLKHPIVVLFRDNQIRYGRDRTLSPWGVGESHRLASILVSDGAIATIRKHVATMGPSGMFATLGWEGVKEFTIPFPKLDVDLSTSPQVIDNLDHPQIVASDYGRDRYMAHMTVEALGKRIADIASNICTVDPDGRISCRQPKEPTVLYLFDRLTEAAAECRLRGIAPPPWTTPLHPRAEWPASFSKTYLGKPVSLETQRSLPPTYLVKYGKEEYLRPMLEHGRMRICAASAYADVSLNPSRRDNELSAELDVRVFGIGGLAGFSCATGDQSFLRSAVRKQGDTNYYVCCLSNELSIRLLNDFESDSCVVIFDREEFRMRLLRAVEKILPGWQAVAADVEYYDPLNVSVNEVDIVRSKHFRFAYQAEHRIAWLPPRPVGTASPIEVELGDLRDICELIVIADRVNSSSH